MHLRHFYAKNLPTVPCRGLCTAGCGPIDLEGVEASALQEQGIALPVVVDHAIHGPLTCSHLTDAGRCAIYENRPLICRLFGAVRAMTCPHGCVPAGGYLRDDRAGDLFRQLAEFSTAGGDSRLTRPWEGNDHAHQEDLQTHVPVRGAGEGIQSRGTQADRCRGGERAREAQEALGEKLTMRRIPVDGDLTNVRRLKEGWRDGYLSDTGDVQREPVATGKPLRWDDEDADPAQIGG